MTDITRNKGSEPEFKFLETTKIERQQISLKAGILLYISVKGGFDYYDSIIRIRYPKNYHGNFIEVSLNENGQIISKKIELTDEGYISFHFTDIENAIVVRNFLYLGFMSPVAINMELWSENIEGGFTSLS